MLRMLTNKEMALVKKVEVGLRHTPAGLIRLQKVLQDRARHLLRGLQSQSKVCTPASSSATQCSTYRSSFKDRSRHA